MTGFVVERSREELHLVGECGGDSDQLVSYGADQVVHFNRG